MLTSLPPSSPPPQKMVPAEEEGALVSARRQMTVPVVRKFSSTTEPKHSQPVAQQIYLNHNATISSVLKSYQTNNEFIILSFHFSISCNNRVRTLIGLDTTLSSSLDIRAYPLLEI